ncbi:uncharacterized protein FIBRA_02664 [Fibroporia radiculosa]|uniref:F-box domain-containing protein n=1 Tax=Fibroporia radiculosa TaxID=599839 RepID=J4HVA4_9APHY|nr:uncharacterized protein FIBRA_02664 [Fibroporia radiculosa]CCM00627.1 predicted protein [Fibroporia radiculosa]
MAAHIPQELRDHIVDVFQDDRESLKTCALIGRVWTSRAQSRLFRSLTVKRLAHYAEWNSFFYSSPHIARHVRALNLMGKPVSFEESELPEEWLWILETLHRVESLIVCACTFPKLSLKITVELPRLLSNIKQLSFLNISMPAGDLWTYLGACTRLRKLAVRLVESPDCKSTASKDERGHIYSRAIGPVDTLECTTTQPVASWLLFNRAHNDFLIRRLALTCYEDSVQNPAQAMNALLTHAAPTLEHLVLSVGSDLGGFPGWNLSRMDKLKTIHLRADSRDLSVLSEWNKQFPHEWMPLTVEDMIQQKLPSLQEVRITLRLLDLHHDSSMRLGRMDAALSGLLGSRQELSFVLNIVGTMVSSTRIGLVRRKVKLALPRTLLWRRQIKEAYYGTNWDEDAVFGGGLDPFARNGLIPGFQGYCRLLF